MHDGYPAVADPQVTYALIEAAAGRASRPTSGSPPPRPASSAPRAGRSRSLPIRYPDLAADLARQRVLNFEMEASALLVLSALARCRAGVVCGVFAQRTTGAFVEGDAKARAEAACVETGLEALAILAEMDRQQTRAGADRWRPSLWNGS